MHVDGQTVQWLPDGPADIDVVRFVCELYGVPLPESAPLESLHASLRADRAVDATHALMCLGVELRYPSYRQGMAPAATDSGAS